LFLAFVIRGFVRGYFLSLPLGMSLAHCNGYSAPNQ